MRVWDKSRSDSVFSVGLIAERLRFNQHTRPGLHPAPQPSSSSPFLRASEASARLNVKGNINFTRSKLFTTLSSALRPPPSLLPATLFWGENMTGGNMHPLGPNAANKVPRVRLRLLNGRWSDSD